MQNYVFYFYFLLSYQESIKLLIASPYGKFLIKNVDNKLIINNDYYYTPFNEVYKKEADITHLNLKNIYNISKSLSHISSKKWEILDKHYISLNYENKKIFFKKIINANRNENRWFNYENNYKRQTKYKLESDENIQQYEKNVLSEFYMVFRIIVFEELISTGILNEFVPNLNITDKSKLPQNTFSLQKKRKDLIKEMFKKEKEKWNESYSSCISRTLF
jgi:hypothetical protein